MSRKMSKARITRAHRQADRLKGHRGISNRYALATWQVQQGQRAGYKR